MDFLHLDLYINSGRNLQAHQSIHALRGRINNVNQTLVNAHLKLLPGVLVHECRAVHGKLRLFGRQRNGANYLSAVSLGSINDIFGRLVNNLIVVGAYFYPDPANRFLSFLWRCCGCMSRHKEQSEAPRKNRGAVCHYLIILVTTPAPTVLPPSRMAKFIFSSMATGTINLEVILTVSPGMTISVPAGNSTSPVTSVVRI